MANRSYLYNLSNRPSAYADRPERINGLSEWAYDVPLSYYILMSGNPELCASLISDGLEDEDEDDEDEDEDEYEAAPKPKMRLYAVSGEFSIGYQRLKKLMNILRFCLEEHSWLPRWLKSRKAASKALQQLDETQSFLDAQTERFLLLETIELDLMLENQEEPLLALVEQHLALSRLAGQAIDALPEHPRKAAAVLLEALEGKHKEPLNIFHGLKLSEEFDTEDGKSWGFTNWSQVLYFGLWNRAEFDKRNA